MAMELVLELVDEETELLLLEETDELTLDDVEELTLDDELLETLLEVDEPPPWLYVMLRQLLSAGPG